MQCSSPVALTLVLALAAACDGSSDSGSKAEFGCREPMDETFCSQFILEDEGDLEATQESCALGGVREVIDSCPSDGVAGCCVLVTAQYIAHECYYPPTTTEQVQEQCTTLGQDFVAAP